MYIIHNENYSKINMKFIKPLPMQIYIFFLIGA